MHRNAPLAFALSLLLASRALADEVVFKNGEKLIGKIEKVVDGKLTIDSKSVGKVTVDFANVDTFSTDAPIEIHFQDGTVTKQKISASQPGQIAIEKAGVLEAQSLPIAQIAKVNPPPVKWDGSVTSSLLFTRGNADTQTASIDARALRRSDDDRIRAETFWIAARQRDDVTGEWETTARSLEGALQYDYYFSKRVYGWAQVKGKKDDVAELDLRFQAGAGAGVQWIESESLNVSTEAGLLWMSENFADATPDEDQAAVRAAYRVDGKPVDGVALFHDVELIDGMDQSKDYLIDANAGVRVTLAGNLYTEAKVQLDYDRRPAAGAESTDIRYIFGLGWSF